MTPATCRSCGAAITWATTVHGKPMPVDAVPDPGGNVVLLPPEDPREAPRALVLDKRGDYRRSATWLENGVHLAKLERYTSHFANCPNAAEHRRSP